MTNDDDVHFHIIHDDGTLTPVTEAELAPTPEELREQRLWRQDYRYWTTSTAMRNAPAMSEEQFFRLIDRACDESLLCVSERLKLVYHLIKRQPKLHYRKRDEVRRRLANVLRACGDALEPCR